MKNKLFVILLLLSFFSYAEDAVHLNVNDKAPFDGFLITPAKVNQFAQTVNERDNLQQLNNSLNTSINLQTDIITHKDTQINLLLDQNDKLAKTAAASQTINDWVKVGYFLGGILLIGASGYAYHSFTK